MWIKILKGCEYLLKLVSLDGLKKYHTKVKELLNGKEEDGVHIETGVWSPKCQNYDGSYTNTYVNPGGPAYYLCNGKYVKIGPHVILEFEWQHVPNIGYYANSDYPNIYLESFPFARRGKYEFLNAVYIQVAEGGIWKGLKYSGNALRSTEGLSFGCNQMAPSAPYHVTIEYLTNY